MLEVVPTTSNIVINRTEIHFGGGYLTSNILLVGLQIGGGLERL